jgi:hypothetical protein
MSVDPLSSFRKRSPEISANRRPNPLRREDAVIVGNCPAAANGERSKNKKFSEKLIDLFQTIGFFFKRLDKKPPARTLRSHELKNRLIKSGRLQTL